MSTTEIAPGTNLADNLANTYGSGLFPENFPNKNEINRELISILKHHFATKTAKYPQYKGHWDGWALGKIIKNAEFKSGANLFVGDIVLVQPKTRLGLYLNWEVEVWSPRSEYGLSMDASHVQILTWTSPVK